MSATTIWVMFLKTGKLDEAIKAEKSILLKPEYVEVN